MYFIVYRYKDDDLLQQLSLARSLLHYYSTTGRSKNAKGDETLPQGQDVKKYMNY